MDPERRQTLLEWLVVGLAAAVRIAGAFLRRPWHDEYFTAWVAGLPWRDIVPALRLDSGPPLPYVATKLVALTGLPAVGAARAVAVVAGTLAVLLAMRAARRSLGAAAALTTGLLVALHPLAVAWSCEGRAYALLLLAVAWAWERLESLAAGGRGGLGLAAALALACWSHAFGLILAVAVAAAALMIVGEARIRALVGIAVGVATSVPWVGVAAGQPAAAVAWMTRAWEAMPPLDRALAPVRFLSPLAPFGHQVDLPSAPLGVQIVGGLLCGLLLAGASRALRPLALFALPVLGLTTLAIAGLPAFYPGRGEALFLVPFLALLAAGVARHRLWAVAAGVLIAGAAAMTLVALLAWHRQPPRGEERLAAAVRTAMPEGGTVVIGGYWRLGLVHHLGADAARFAVVNVPAGAARHPGWYDEDVEPPRRSEVDALAADLARDRRPVAMVVTPGIGTAPALHALADSLGLARVAEVPGGELYLPRRSAP